jgi:hypothetical protein
MRPTASRSSGRPVAGKTSPPPTGCGPTCLHAAHRQTHRIGLRPLRPKTRALTARRAERWLPP